IRAGLDIFGQNPQANNSQTYDCVHCQRSFPAQRYAPHLEKCLGLSGRSSSRAASRRMGAGERAGSGSPFTPVSYSDERDASDSDKDLIEKKRKKNASSTNGSQTNGGSGSSLNGSDYGASNLIKSSSSNASKAKKQKSDSSDYPLKTQKSSLLAKASKGSSSSKLKGLGLHTPSSVSVTPVGEISLGYLDDDLLLANGKSLQNGAGSNSNVNNILSNGGNNSINSNGSASQKLSSSNSKRGSGGISSSKRPPGSGSGSGSSKNGQVALSSSSSFFERLKAIGSRDGASDSSGSDDDSHDGDYRKESGAREKKEKEKSGNRGKGSSYAGSAGTSSQPLPPVVIRLKKASAFTGHGSDSVDTDFI
ncbi:Ataxin-7-like protein 3, partial [Lobosporangium transversale]